MLIVEVLFDPKEFLGFRQRVKLFSNGRWKEEAYRGVIAAGQRTKTKVQRAVYNQMALRPGNYQSYVVANTRGIKRRADVSYSIVASQKGGDIELYKGLKVLKRSGRAASRFNMGRTGIDRGYVRSGVWNNPRTFKRSFEQNGTPLALIPGGDGKFRWPRAFWTHDNRSWQPRGADGRFASTGNRGYKIRHLYGPALSKEYVLGNTLQTFVNFAPDELDRQVLKRLMKLL